MFQALVAIYSVNQIIPHLGTELRTNSKLVFLGLQLPRTVHKRLGQMRSAALQYLRLSLLPSDNLIRKPEMVLAIHSLVQTTSVVPREDSLLL